MRRETFTVFADYFQFYLWDRDVDPQAPVDYSESDIEKRVKVVPNVVVVQPVRNTEVPVELEIREDQPVEDISNWDHVVRCSLDVPSGNLQVHECTGSPVIDLSIDPGAYRALILFRGLDGLSEDGLDGEDYYRIVLWPGDECELSVLKQWTDERAV